MNAMGYWTQASPAANSIEIPMKDSDEVVEVMLDEFPNDANEIVEILKTEEAPLHLWRRFAIEYYKRQHPDAFYLILSEATRPGYFQKYQASNKERISVLNSISAYHAGLAAKEKDTVKRVDHYNKATSRVKEAESIDINDLNTGLVKGLMLLAQGDLNLASKQFDNVVSHSPDNVPALLGKACIEFNNKEYKSAMRLYKKALRVLPNNTPQIRLGIGLCYHQLGQEDKARLAYERCLQMDENNVQALVGLGMLDINTGDNEKISAGMQRLRRAYDIDRTHPIVLNQLALHFFYRGEYAKVESLAMNAYHSTEVEIIKAESCLITARAHHAREDYDAAFSHYYQATKLSPSSVFAQYGLGQMYIQRGELTSACECFEKVLASEPTNYEAQKIIGSLYGRLPGQRTKGIQYLRQVTQLAPEDVEAWLELAEFLEGTNLAESLQAYEKAATIWREQIELPFPPELWNNIGALHHKLGHFSKAKECYEKAVDECERMKDATEDPDEKVYADGLKLTLLYNQASLLEDSMEIAAAKQIFADITRDHPGYVDAHLRLGLMAMKVGQHLEAGEHFKEVINFDQNNPDPRTLLAMSRINTSEYGPAQKSLESILMRPAVLDVPATSLGALSSGASYGGKNDVYALVALGSVTHRMAKREQEHQKSNELLKRSLDLYMKALHLNPRNPFAANGVGVLLAERGFFREARDIFLQVREVISDNADVWINLAHVNFELELYHEAIKIYESALKKLLNNHDVVTMLYLARVYFVLGKIEKNVIPLMTARRYLEKALHMRPWDMSIRFNVALTEQETAVVIGNLPAARRTFDQVQQALNMVQQSRTTFDYLKKTEPYPAKSYEQAMASTRENYATVLLPFLQKQLNIQRKADDDNAKKMESLLHDKSEASLVEQNLREAEKREMEEKREMARRAAEQDKQKFRELYESTMRSSEKTPKRQGRRRGDGAEADEGEGGAGGAGGDDSEDGEEHKKKKRGSRAKKSSGGEDEDEDKQKKRTRKSPKTTRRKRVDSDAGSGGSDDNADTPKRKRSFKRKEKATTSDDEEEEPESDSEKTPKKRGRLQKKKAVRQMDDEIDEDDLVIDDAANNETED